MSNPPVNKGSHAAADDPALRQILQSVRDLRFGSLEIIVHEGRIVQIERREKLRVDAPAARARTCSLSQTPRP
jgi:hypothetical protein